MTFATANVMDTSDPHFLSAGFARNPIRKAGEEEKRKKGDGSIREGGSVRLFHILPAFP